MDCRLLSQQEEIEIGRKAHAGDLEARNALVMHNQRFLIKIVTSFARKHPGHALMDLISEANLGLIHAAELFDPDTGFRFTTYSANWILQALGRYVNEQSDMIRIPQHQAENLRRIRQAKAAGVDNSRLCEATGVSRQDIDLMMPYLHPTVSLDAPVTGEASGTTFCELISDGTEPQDAAMTRYVLKTILSRIPKKYRDILVKRYGLFNGKSMTLAEIADEYGMSRERIRQLEMKALKLCRRCA